MSSDLRIKPGEVPVKLNLAQETKLKAFWLSSNSQYDFFNSWIANATGAKYSVVDDEGFLHLVFKDDEAAVMFRLKYAEYL